MFMDTSSIQPGAEWPGRIRSALDSAKVVIVILGPEWIRVGNEWGKRHIDKKSDWVRNEIEQALVQGKEVIPVLVRDARIPPKNMLPMSIRSLPDKQAIPIRTSFWAHDVKLLESRLASLTKIPAAEESVVLYPVRPSGRSEPISESVGPYPVPAPEKPDPISDESLQVALNGTLSKWRVVTPLPEEPGQVRAELFREYTFKTFQDAIRFMSEVAPGCDIAIHHPRWENIWRTLRVYLTTWDIDHQISDRDIQLAKYFDAAYSEFNGKDSKD